MLKRAEAMDSLRAIRFTTHVAAVAAIAALLFLASGCQEGNGPLSLSQYRKEISQIHDGLAMGIGEFLEELPAIDLQDYRQLQLLKELYEGMSGLFRSSYAAANSLDPPVEASMLHQFLLGFYAAGEKTTGDSAAGIGFVRSVLPMLADLENLALAHLPEEADFAQVQAAASEDKATLEDYLEDTERMKVIPDLEEEHRQLVGCFRDLKDKVEAVRTGYSRENQVPLEDFMAFHVYKMETIQRLKAELVGWVASREARVDHLLRVGKDLGKMIYELR